MPEEKLPLRYGPWTITERRAVYTDPWLKVVKDDVIRPDGDPGTYCVVHLKAGVSVLAVDEDLNAYLTEEFHYAVGKVTIESASGGIDREETRLEAAQRELREELGITADDWTEFGMVDPFTANVLSPTGLFLAQGLTFGETEQEGTEQIRCVKLPFGEVVVMAMDGRITHAPSVALILKAARHLGL